MKPFPHKEVNAIDHEMCELRDEISKLKIALQNSQSCLNALYQKKKDLIADASAEGNLFEQMFGTDTPLAETYGG